MTCLVAVQIAMLFKTEMCSNSSRQQRFVVQIASDARNKITYRKSTSLLGGLACQEEVRTCIS